MITIVVTTQDEYDEMMQFAKKYVCMRMSFGECANYPPHSCDKCYRVNHIRFGIRVNSPVEVDSGSADSL